MSFKEKYNPQGAKNRKTWRTSHKRSSITMTKTAFQQLQDGFSRHNDDGTTTKVDGLGTPLGVLNYIRNANCILPHLVEVGIE